MGKIKGIAKGVRKTKSRLAGSVGLFNLTQLQLHGKDHQDLFLITQGQLITSFLQIKDDLELLGLAARFYELVDRLTPDHQPLPEIFFLLKHAMNLLTAGLAPIIVEAWFEIRLLDYIGYGPILVTCMTCGGDPIHAAYVPEKGGIVCEGCGNGSVLTLSRGARALLNKLRQADSDTVQRIRMEKGMGREISRFLTAAFQYQIGHGLNSDKFRQAVSNGD